MVGEDLPDGFESKRVVFDIVDALMLENGLVRVAFSDEDTRRVEGVGEYELLAYEWLDLFWGYSGRYL